MHGRQAGREKGGNKKVNSDRQTAMSALGQKQTSCAAKAMSALPPIATSIAFFGMSALGRFCCKSRKLQGYEFFAKTRNEKQSPIRVASIALPKSPVSLT